MKQIALILSFSDEVDVEQIKNLVQDRVLREDTEGLVFSQNDDNHLEISFRNNIERKVLEERLENIQKDASMSNDNFHWQIII